MQPTLSSLIKSTITTLSAVSLCLSLQAADATGSWKWSMTNQNGQVYESTLKLKQEGEKLTGTVTGRNGNEVKVEAGKVQKETLSFTVTRERNGQSFTTKYSGKLEADTIKGTSETERNGEARKRDWVAKRDAGAEVAGLWKWTMARPDGQTMERKIKLKVEGGKLSGTSFWNDSETPIEEAKLDGKKVSFQVTRERDGNKFTVKYTGAVEGDSLKGKIEANFGGEARSFDWDAKRAKE